MFVKSLNGLRKEVWLKEELLSWLKEWSAVFLVIQPIRCELERQLLLFVPWSEKKNDESAFFTTHHPLKRKISSLFGTFFLKHCI